MQYKSVFIYTYGCQMNVHDSEKMLGLLCDNGYVSADKPENADLILFNTCAIRAKAEQKFYSQLGRTKSLKRRRPEMKIAVAGCIAQDEKERLFEKAPFVDFILGPQNLHLLNSMLTRSKGAAFESNPWIGAQELPAKRNSGIKAWVSIMFGCNNFCSYCIVPYTRGREISRPSNSIFSEIRDLRLRGYKEITLLGQNVNSYNSDTDFPGLLREVDKIGIERIRFVTSHPRDLSKDLIEAIADLPGVCEHLHLPLQCGSDRILKAMNRGYTFRDYAKKTEMIRSRVPGIAITTDIIAGFPGEEDGDYRQTIRALEEIAFDGIFAFKFSPRKGTKAFDMDGQISDEIKSERLNAILKVQEQITLKKNKAIEGTVQEILIEGPSESDRAMLTGRTRTNKIVNLPDCGAGEGSFLNVRIEKACLHSLAGIHTE